MPKLIYQCKSCKTYTLDSQECPNCGAAVRIAHPAPFSGTDKWGKYRRRAKRRSKRNTQKPNN